MSNLGALQRIVGNLGELQMIMSNFPGIMSNTLELLKIVGNVSVTKGNYGEL